MTKLDPTSRPIKYLNNKIKGMNKSEAQLKAGYADIYHGTRIEKSKQYQEGLQELLLAESKVAKEHNKNILQDNDRGAKNKAIDMYYKLKKAYPTDSTSIEDGDVSITIKKG